MINDRHHTLVKIIYNDLRCCGKIQLFLLLLIIISAVLVIWITYQTRCMINSREIYILKKYSLECEWNNLILEKEILSDYTRIEQIAINKLHMNHINPLLKDTWSN